MHGVSAWHAESPGTHYFAIRLIKYRLDYTKVPVLSTVYNVHSFRFSIQENKKLHCRHFELQSCFIDEHRFYGIFLAVDHRRFGSIPFGFRLNRCGDIRLWLFFRSRRRFPAHYLFFDVPNCLSSRSMMSHEASFIFAHSSSDLIDDIIDRSVHVMALRAGLKRNVIAAMQNHLCSVTVFLNVHNYLYFDNFWIIKVKASQPASAILFHRFRDADMPPSHLDWWICILYLHIWALSFWVTDR